MRKGINVIYKSIYNRRGDYSNNKDSRSPLFNIIPAGRASIENPISGFEK
jgi:hypothetical protein